MKTYIFILLLVLFLSFFGGYKYAKLSISSKEKIVTDTLVMPIYIPNDTIIKYKSKIKIITENIKDSNTINSLLDTINNLYSKLEKLQAKQIAILDTIFPNSKDTLFLQFDKVTDVFAPIYLKRSVYNIPIEIKTIYIPVEKENHSIFVDFGIGLGAFGLGYIVGR